MSAPIGRTPAGLGIVGPNPDLDHDPGPAAGSDIFTKSSPAPPPTRSAQAGSAPFSALSSAAQRSDVGCKRVQMIKRLIGSVGYEVVLVVGGDKDGWTGNWW